MIRYPNAAAPVESGFCPALPDQADLGDFVRLGRVNQGDDLTVVALGVCLAPAREAVESLKVKCADKTIDLYSARSVLPFDYETMLKSIHHTGRLLLIEDGVEQGGFGTLVAAQVARLEPGTLIDYAGVSLPTLGQATRSELIREESLDKEGLEKRMSRLLALERTGS